MTGDAVGVGISVSAPDVTIADLTIRDVRVSRHPGSRRAGRARASRCTTRGCWTPASSCSRAASPSRGCTPTTAWSPVRSSAYTTHAPSDYTNGVDLLATSGWVIRDNRFARIRGPEPDSWRAGPAILVWAAAEDTVVERNLIVDSFRGIALGLTEEPHRYARNGVRAYDHAGGVVRNNVVVNLNRWADEAIEANAARGARIEHNTVLVEGSTPWSIGVRFPMSDALIRNNLTNHRIFLRDGGRAEP